MRCEFPLSTRCANGHPQKWKCHNGSPATCPKCERERKATKQADAAQAKIREQREAERRRYQQEMTQLEEWMARLTFGNKGTHAVQKDGTSNWFHY